MSMTDHQRFYLGLAATVPVGIALTAVAIYLHLIASVAAFDARSYAVAMQENQRLRVEAVELRTTIETLEVDAFGHKKVLATTTSAWDACRRQAEGLVGVR